VEVLLVVQAAQPRRAEVLLVQVEYFVVALAAAVAVVKDPTPVMAAPAAGELYLQEEGVEAEVKKKLPVAEVVVFMKLVDRDRTPQTLEVVVELGHLEAQARLQA